MFDYKIKVCTLCIITSPPPLENSKNNSKPKILLGYKKRGMGAGLWNGFGGKVEDGEDVVSAVNRELEEEAGIKAINLKLCGKIYFTFGNENIITEGVVYKSHSYTGIIKETEEMKPCWFNIDEIPYDKMWSDDILWLPILLEGYFFHAYFHFDDNKKIENENENLSTPQWGTPLWGKVRRIIK